MSTPMTGLAPGHLPEVSIDSDAPYWPTDAAIDAAVGEELSVDVITEMWLLTQKMVEAENLRFARLEDKAKSLLAAAGASVAFTMSIGGAASAMTTTSRSVPWVSFGVFAVLGTSVVGVVSALLAAVALNVSKTGKSWRAQSLFNAATIARASKLGVSEYRLALIKDGWQMIRPLHEANEDLAIRLRRAQYVFVGFLCCLLGAVAGVVFKL